MKKKLTTVIMLLLCIGMTVPSMAHRYRRAQGDNPLQIVGWVLHPVGLAAEFVIMRPLHWVVSRSHLDIVFGHRARVAEDGTYFEWTHGDFSPSVAVERADFERWRAEQRPVQETTTVRTMHGTSTATERYETERVQQFVHEPADQQVLIEPEQMEMQEEQEGEGLTLTDEQIEESEAIQEETTTPTE